jgi:hypothetical protein
MQLKLTDREIIAVIAAVQLATKLAPENNLISNVAVNTAKKLQGELDPNNEFTKDLETNWQIIAGDTLTTDLDELTTAIKAM